MFINISVATFSVIFYEFNIGFLKMFTLSIILIAVFDESLLEWVQDCMGRRVGKIETGKKHSTYDPYSRVSEVLGKCQVRVLTVATGTLNDGDM